ncbi:ABC transporter substrate-binding protein [sulfur-oxidizing endosymbiont of Gigantopelta aegis]|uniref:ABC transporter substrate-binding protein n=1 Tax=sulfur-oxidizing endosymbiont of Gigantopelta aegis TaxID=2794934 RepID=UPI001BE4051F|nr:ABC transporter substrate-binding protein [sulfur-oxidizing endosymbiont of Gigantopelta aegis]
MTIVSVILLSAIIISFNLLSKQVINIGINDWTGYDPFIIADKQALFKQQDLNLNVIRYKSADEGIQALKNGEIKGATLTLDEAVILHKSGFRVKTVLIIDFSSGGDMIIGQSSIKDMSMIAGKRVGYEGSLVGEFLLHRALSNNQINITDIELVSVSSDNWLSAFKNKKIDALVCYNPDATTLLKHNNAQLLFSSKEIPYEIIDVLVFEEQFFYNNKIAIQKIVSTWFNALDFIKRDINTAIDIIAQEKKINIAEYKDTLAQLISPDLKQNQQLFDENSQQNIYKYSQVTIDFLLDKGLLSSRVNTDEFFTSEIITTLKN